MHNEVMQKQKLIAITEVTLKEVMAIKRQRVMTN